MITCMDPNGIEAWGWPNECPGLAGDSLASMKPSAKSRALEWPNETGSPRLSEHEGCGVGLPITASR